MNVEGFGIFQDELPPIDQGFIDFSTWFGAENSHKPLEIEIGSGKGTFLVQQAALTPNVNYIGIEWAKAYWKYAADRARRHNLTNVKVVRAEAAGFIRSYVAPLSLRQVHIYFPDPWPKARHNRRRIVQEPFLRTLVEKLQPNGCIRLATDHSDYFAWMEEHAAKADDVLERLEYQSPESAGEGELVGSNFERKYRREGRPFHGMVLRKR
jgi:tRNA (guanine-N7-)-methyltransferase